ncbi:hypothetical protein T4B_7534 [Trichinella pseudospiralis]|uniref:Uncharacterized protein n=1 Tax=Trichinella pseudospiralis TaxID=6337 RepID=A0A0V1J9Q6_TRIPS|nr:hypothetical protein T4A_8464 [Trichinella pseudospiralis]KRZ31718.1 hypothetical protein T4B_7534 [Trichinella pseudospiralis]
MTFISMASLKPICKVYNLVPVTAEEKRCRFEQYEMVVMGFISVNQFRRRRQSVCSLISRSTLSSNVLIKRIIALRPPGRRFRLPSSLKLCRCALISLLFMSSGNVVRGRQASKQASSQAGMCLSFPKRRRSV